MPLLNDICPDSGVARRIGGSIVASSDEMASRRFRKREGREMEVWRIRWSALNASELNDLREIYAAYGKTAPLAWTPPNEPDSTRAFRISDYKDKCESAANYSAEMDLTYLPGVEPPA